MYRLYLEFDSASETTVHILKLEFKTPQELKDHMTKMANYASLTFENNGKIYTYPRERLMSIEAKL